jgi:hypothetical protein
LYQVKQLKLYNYEFGVLQKANGRFARQIAKRERRKEKRQ